MKTRQMMLVIEANAYKAWRLAICAANKETFEELENPKVGDLVLEMSSRGMGTRIEDRLGRLVSVGDEEPPSLTQEDYDQDAWDGQEWPPYYEKVWNIETLDGRPYKWWNANFIKVSE